VRKRSLASLAATAALASGTAALASGIVAAQDRTALYSSLDAASLIGKPVTDSKWEQVARVDSVLLDPETGKITFVVVSFVDGNERVALPWKAIELDHRGRARLVAKQVGSAGGFTIGALPSLDRPPVTLVESEAFEAAPPAEVRGFKAESNGRALLQGRVVGTMTVPGKSGRRVKLVLMAGTESVGVDLGPEEALRGIGLALRAGDMVQIEARKTGEDELRASVVQLGGASFQIPGS
jgi:hypothetical protein